MKTLESLWQSPKDWGREYRMRRRILKDLGMTYRQYLESAHWAELSQKIRIRDNFKCRACSGLSVDIHHRTYARLGREVDSDLISLCRECHDQVHAELSPAAVKVRLIPQAYVPVTAGQKRRNIRQRNQNADAKAKKLEIKRQKSLQKDAQPVSSRTRFAACAGCQRVTAIRDDLCRSCREIVSSKKNDA